MRHNLFGAPNEAHIMVHEDDTFKVQHIVKGNTVDEVLRSVHYDPDALITSPQTKRKASAKGDAAEALRALLTEERQLHTYLEI
jgi:arginine decarboxylase